MKYKGLVLVVDGNNYLMRAQFATPALSNSEGQPTNAIKGFFNILLADIYSLKPSHVIVSFDQGGKKSWRKKLYPDYKSSRHKEELPQPFIDAFSQKPLIQKLLKYIGIRTSYIKGVEADDLIGTLAVKFKELGYLVVISSKDKDFAQLVCSSVNILVAESRDLLDEDGIKNKFGVYPHQIIDYLALTGDGSDSIPGVYKCGGKTAAKLLTAHKTLKKVLKNKHTFTPALRKNITAVEHNFPLTRKLITIKTDFKLKTNPSNSKLPTSVKDTTRFNKLCSALELEQTSKQILRMLKTQK